MSVATDSVILTYGGFLHAAVEYSPLCGSSVKWRQAAEFPLYDIDSPEDVQAIAEWARRAEFGWWTGQPTVCDRCLEQIAGAPDDN